MKVDIKIWFGEEKDIDSPPDYTERFEFDSQDKEVVTEKANEKAREIIKKLGKDEVWLLLEKVG